MKLRNKKTGEIVDWDGVHLTNDIDGEMFDSLADLNEEWEDYKPAESLIKDEKIRKAVRVWAEANGFETTDPLRYTFTDELEVVSFDNGTNLINIMFCGFPDGIKGLYHLEWYTIAELCGEEEE